MQTDAGKALQEKHARTPLQLRHPGNNLRRHGHATAPSCRGPLLSASAEVLDDRARSRDSKAKPATRLPRRGPIGTSSREHDERTEDGEADKGTRWRGLMAPLALSVSCELRCRMAKRRRI